MQNVYANMEGNVLVHISAPALGLSSMHWAVVSWGQSQLTRESVYDAKYIYRCALLVTLMRLTLPASTDCFSPMRLCLIKVVYADAFCMAGHAKRSGAICGLDLFLRHASKRCCAAARALDT